MRFSLLLDFIQIKKMKGEHVNQWAERGHIKLLELVKKRGWNLNEGIKPYNMKQIHSAADEGKGEVISLLINSGVNINKKDMYKNSPLHHACTHGHIEVVELLLKLGADINAKNQIKYNPLMFSISNGNKMIINLLLSKGAKVEYNTLVLACGKSLEVQVFVKKFDYLH